MTLPGSVAKVPRADFRVNPGFWIKPCLGHDRFNRQGRSGSSGKFDFTEPSHRDRMRPALDPLRGYWPMIAWTLSAPGRRRQFLAWTLIALVGSSAGCGAMGKHKPQPGCVDPNQPRELEMVSMPPYVIEPPDELEISVRPAAVELPLTTVTVQADGVVDLGFIGDVYLAGLTLSQAEQKIAEHLDPIARRRKVREPVEVSVRLVNGSQSKFFYVMGAVTTQGRFPIVGNETVIDALLTAGLRSNSNPEKAYLVRPHPINGPDQILKIDWEGIKNRGDTMTNYQLFPGDRLVVPGGRPPGLLGSLFGG